MAEVIIPDLSTATSFDKNALMPFDSGTETFKITAENFGKSIALLMSFVQAKIVGAGSLTAALAQNTLELDSSVGAFNLQLPDPAVCAGLTFRIKDVGAVLSTKPVTLVRHGSEKIEGLAQSYVLLADGGLWNVYCNGVDWLIY